MEPETWNVISAGNAPEILVGPIVRKVTDTFVSVFIVTKSAFKAKLKIFTKPDLSQSIESLEPFTPTNIGVNLYANLLHITFAPEDSRKLCFYDILFINDNNTSTNFSFSSIPNIKEYCLGENLYPSFVIPPSDPIELKLLHSSCRKLHGEFIDAFIAAEKLLDDNVDFDTGNWKANAERPQILCLTGDQIYADDVSDIVLHMIQKVNDEFINLSFETDLVIIGLAPNLDSISIDDLNPGKRAKIITDNNGAKFTPDVEVAGSHLIKMGEYFAMYMLAWSDVFWDFNNLPLIGHVYPDILTLTEEKRNELTKKYDKDIANLKGNDFKKIKKILANISTMMILDDHEVTDDLFLDKKWVKDTIGINGSALGKRILSNSLVAYSIFQDWGNKPLDYVETTSNGYKLLNNFSTSNVETKLSNFNKYVFPTLSFEIGEVNDTDLKHLELINDLSKNIDFHYKYFPNSANKYEIVALNCRTNRYFKNNTAIANLISRGNLSNQVGSNNCSTLELSILIAPTPVFGHEKTEDIQLLFSSFPSREKKLTYDAEAWGLNKNGREEFLSKLYLRKHSVSPSILKRHSVIILSGDVHYGFAKRIKYKAEKQTGENNYNTRVLIANFCASSLKNETSSTLYQNSGKNDENIIFKGRTVGDELKPAFGTMLFDYEYEVEQISKVNNLYEPPAFGSNDLTLGFLKKHRKIEGTGNHLIGFNNIGLISFTGAESTFKVIQQLYWPSGANPIDREVDYVFQGSIYEIDFYNNI
jgi:hypothetical protein